MTFISIIKKNFIHNFKKYISFYFVNSLIVAMLFMYGNLMYNSKVIEDVGNSSLYEIMKISLFGICIFSVIFITYTNISFLKSRGKEFGTYLTLGMTWKDLTKVILVENIGVMIVSLLTGLISGVLFSRLFYMILNKILTSSKINYELNLKGFIVSIGVFVLIFLCNILFNIIYIRKVSIINVIKSSKNKEVGKERVILGVISLVIFFMSAYMMPKILFAESFKGNNYMVGVCVAIIIICPYMIIASLMALIKNVLTKFPKVYNKNLLVLSNLSHRFLAYKNIIYMVSLLLTGAVFFIGTTYSLYTTSKKYIEKSNPFDIVFVESHKYNKVNKEKVEQLIKDNKGVIKDYKQLEFLELQEFRENNNDMTLWSDGQSVISLSNYNKHMNKKYTLDRNDALYVVINREEREQKHPTSILTCMSEEKMSEVKNVAAENDYKINKEEAYKFLKGSEYIGIDKENIKEIEERYANRIWTNEYTIENTFVVSDKLYEKLKYLVPIKNIKKINLINIDNSEKPFYSLTNYLREENGLDSSFWNKGSLFGSNSKDERGEKESYRPVYKKELIDLQLESNGINFFCMMFIGIMFIIANGVVLYYKILTDIEAEKERITSLSRIGISVDELKKNISKELKIIFITPVIIGSSLGLYFIYALYYNTMGELMKPIVQSTLVVITFIIISQLVFYIAGKKKCFNEIIFK